VGCVDCGGGGGGTAELDPTGGAAGGPFGRAKPCKPDEGSTDVSVVAGLGVGGATFANMLLFGVATASIVPSSMTGSWVASLA